MDNQSDEAGRIASEYIQRHGGEAMLRIDAAIAQALGSARWNDHNMLLRARLRLRRLQLFERISLRMRKAPLAGSGGMAA